MPAIRRSNRNSRTVMAGSRIETVEREETRGQLLLHTACRRERLSAEKTLRQDWAVVRFINNLPREPKPSRIRGSVVALSRRADLKIAWGPGPCGGEQRRGDLARA